MTGCFSTTSVWTERWTWTDRMPTIHGWDLSFGSIWDGMADWNKCDVSDAVFLHTCVVSRAVSSYRQDELQPRIDVSIHRGPPCGRCPGSTSQPQPGSEFGQDVKTGWEDGGEGEGEESRPSPPGSQDSSTLPNDSSKMAKIKPSGSGWS